MKTLLLLVAVCALPLCAEDWSKTFEVSGKPTVTVKTDDAQVRIHSCDCKRVEAHVTWEGYKPDRIQITPNQNGDHVSLEVKLHNNHFGVNISGMHHQYVHVEMTVPKELNIDVETGDGQVEAQDLKGDLRFRTGDGRMELTGMDGTLEARSGDGRMNVDGRFDSLQVQTSDGPVNVAARAGSQINSEWSVRTGDGSVHLRLPQDIHANFSAHTGDGSIHTEFPMVVSGNITENRHNVQGTINGGGGTLTIHTGDGSVSIEKM